MICDNPTPVLPFLVRLRCQYMHPKSTTNANINYQRGNHAIARNLYCGVSKEIAKEIGQQAHPRDGKLIRPFLPTMATNRISMVDCYRPSGAVGVESQSIYTYKPTYKAKVGYDFATGIGTINAANLVNAWETCLY